jgi:beta-glucosidase
VSFRLRNSGTRRATEVPQVYAELPDPSSTVQQPPRALRQFTKVTLAAGESTTVVLRLDRRSFSYWDVRRNDWAVAAGRHRVAVGASSRDIRLRQDVAPIIE